MDQLALSLEYNSKIAVGEFIFHHEILFRHCTYNNFPRELSVQKFFYTFVNEVT